MNPRILEVLEISLPVFALIGLGKILGMRKVMNAEQRSFVNWLVFNFSLPALIFRGVSRQRIDRLLDPGLVVGALLPIAAITLVFLALRRLLGYRGGYAAAFVFGSFWANVSYMGFPLSQNAFGDEGFAAAAVYNAFAMPVFVILGFLIIGAFVAGEGRQSPGQAIRRAVLNPVVLSAVAGVAFAGIAHLLCADQGSLPIPHAGLVAVGIVGKFLDMVGAMGLPLALLSIGAALKLQHAEGHALPLGMIMLGKLVLVPLFSLLTFRLVLPLLGLTASPVVVGVTVLLSSTPNAVASYVVACQIGVEEGFVSTMLVATTCASVVSIPVWLYFLI